MEWAAQEAEVSSYSQDAQVTARKVGLPDCVGHYLLEERREVLDRDLPFTDAPEMFCFGLLEYFDMPQLTALASRR